MPELVSIEGELGEKPVVAGVSEYRGMLYLMLRYQWRNSNGELQFGKNGINVPLEEGIEAIELLITAYNESTGETWKLVSSSPS
jgi:hypothetical protein